MSIAAIDAGVMLGELARTRSKVAAEIARLARRAVALQERVAASEAQAVRLAALAAAGADPVEVEDLTARIADQGRAVEAQLALVRRAAAEVARLSVDIDVLEGQVFRAVEDTGVQ